MHGAGMVHLQLAINAMTASAQPAHNKSQLGAVQTRSAWPYLPIPLYFSEDTLLAYPLLSRLLKIRRTLCLERKQTTSSNRPATCPSPTSHCSEPFAKREKHCLNRQS